MHAWSLGQKENNNMLPLRRHNFFFPILVPQHFFSYFYQNSGNPLGNSRKFSGIPKISREFPEILVNSPIFKRKIKCPPPQLFYFSRNGNILFFLAYWIRDARAKQCYHWAKNKKVEFFLKIGEFLTISGSSQEFLGIPINFREFPRGFPEFW